MTKSVQFGRRRYIFSDQLRWWACWGGGHLITVRDCHTDADLGAAWRVRALAFGGPAEPDESWAGPWRGWVAQLDGRVCGFARVWPYRQYFGGVAVPMGGLASVAVLPHARGCGVATALLDTSLPAMRAAGQPLSALYPSVARLYRARGWEHVGVQEWVDLPASELRSITAPFAPVPLRPAEPADLPAVHRCYQALARTVDGMLDRGGPAFDLVELLGLDVVTVADGPGELRGFVSAVRDDPGLVVYDLVALDVDAGRALLASLASWAGQLPAVRLRLLQPRALSEIPFGPQPLSSIQWMLRVVDLAAAVAARGWPRAAVLRPGLSVDIDVVDEHAPWNAGRHRLVVHGETVGIERGGSGAVRLTARGLAAWYSGAAGVHQLRRAGLLGGDLAAAAVLDALTGAPGAPRMADTF